MDKQTLLKELESRRVMLNEKQRNQFAYYYYFLTTENAKYNLTSLVLESEVYEKHFYDSLSLLFDNDFEGSVIDVGSGGGFPGLPLKIVKPELDLTFLDATKKKVDFIDALATKLNLDVKTVCARAEEHQEKYDYVIARAVAPLNILLELCANLLKKGGTLIAMKGSHYQEELDEAKTAIKTLGYELDHVYEYNLPSENDMRCNIFLKKARDHNAKYPRNFSKIKKQPL